MFNPTLYFVTPPILEDLQKWEHLIKEAVLGGATMVQIRDKCSPAKIIIKAGRRIHPFLKERDVPLLINDRADIAYVLSAEGVHLGQSDLSIQEARSLLGPEAILGISLENMDQLEAAADANYVAASPVFPSSTKKTLHAWGLDGLHALRQKVSLPLIAIGGIRDNHFPSLIKAGADGVAVVSAIAEAPDPRAAASRLIDQWKRFK